MDGESAGQSAQGMDLAQAARQARFWWYFAAIFLFVNIHHYFMDHVVWRRENPDTRYLREGERRGP